MTDLTIRGETFNVLIEGDETLPVVMLSNSLGTDLHIWDRQMPDLLQHFRVIRYDSRGHGGSVADAGPYSIERLGRDALMILDALGIDKVHWIGLSKGGAIGQWLLINAPDRIERAVLANTAAHFGAPDDWNARIVSVLRDGMADVAETILTRWFSDDFATDHPESVESVRRMLLTTPPVGYAASCAALRDLDVRDALRVIEHPVLVIAGGDDLSVSKDKTDFLAETIPNAKTVTLDARHISNIEDAGGFTKAVIGFLTAKVSARRALSHKVPQPRTVGRRPAGRRPAAARGVATETHARRAPAKAPTPEAQATSSAPKSQAAKIAAAKLSARKAVAAKSAPAKAASARASVRAAPAKTGRGRPSAKLAPPAVKTPRRGATGTARRAAAAAAASKPAPSKTASGKAKVIKAPAPHKSTTAKTFVAKSAALKAKTHATAPRPSAPRAGSRKLASTLSTASKAPAKTAGAKTVRDAAKSVKPSKSVGALKTVGASKTVRASKSAKPTSPKQKPAPVTKAAKLSTGRKRATKAQGHPTGRRKA